MLFTLIVIFWILPAIIALIRKCDDTGSILVISLILGWLPFVSIGCLIWAIVGKTTRVQQAKAKILADAIVNAQRTTIEN